MLHHSKYKSSGQPRKHIFVEKKPRPTVQNGIFIQILDQINPSHSYFRISNSLPCAGDQLYIFWSCIKVGSSSIWPLKRKYSRARTLNGFAKNSALTKNAPNPLSSSALLIDHYKKTLYKDSTSSSKPISNPRQRKLVNLAQEGFKSLRQVPL